MVIVALRGSVTRADWVINLNHGVGNGGVRGILFCPDILANRP